FLWRWGAMPAAAFTIFSVAVSSVYLTFGLRAIDGVPFGKQITPDGNTQGQEGFRVLIFMFLSLVAVAVQYLIFRSPVAVVVATIALVVSAVVLTRLAVRSLETAIRHHLGNISLTSSMLYAEIDID